MMRPEVEEAISYGCKEPGTCRDRLCRDERQRLLALIELGVRLGIEAAAARAESLYAGFDSPWKLRDIDVASVLEGGK